MATIEMNGNMTERLRVMASEKIHKLFGKAPIVVAQYGEYGAYAYCICGDGIKEHVYIDYSDLMADSQHDKAMAYVKTII